jgi:hypothetical protein
VREPLVLQIYMKKAMKHLPLRRRLVRANSQTRIKTMKLKMSKGIEFAALMTSLNAGVSKSLGDAFSARCGTVVALWGFWAKTKGRNF